MDWRKWIIERLPERLRVTGMIAVCMVLTLPIRVLYEEFVAWQRKMRTKVAGTPQVCMLEKIIRDELGLDIRIEEGNGKPIDFIIKTDFVDMDKERRLFALLDRYKLAGKSYGYENAGIVITAQWTGFVCELAGMESKWTGFVCETKDKDINKIKINRTANRVSASPEFVLTSDIIVTFHGNDSYEISISLNKGSQNTVLKDYAVGQPVNSVTLNVYEDEKYKYEIVWE